MRPNRPSFSVIKTEKGYGRQDIRASYFTYRAVGSIVLLVSMTGDLKKLSKLTEPLFLHKSKAIGMLREN